MSASDEKRQGRLYLLRPAEARGPREQQRKIVPPRPGKGERCPRAYSPDELDALYATALSVDWQAMVSLKTPPDGRIDSHAGLMRVLVCMKRKLENLRRRRGFPACLVVTEFDPTQRESGTHYTAGFHIAFASVLSTEQQAVLRCWWLELIGCESNQGRYFQYDARGGGPRLQRYMAKDLRNGRWVKFPVSWLPHRIAHRLWFGTGVKRCSSKNGRELRRCAGLKRKRYDSRGEVDGRSCPARGMTSTDSRSYVAQTESHGEGEHPAHPTTTEWVQLLLDLPPGRGVQSGAGGCAVGRKRRSYDRPAIAQGRRRPARVLDG